MLRRLVTLLWIAAIAGTAFGSPVRGGIGGVGVEWVGDKSITASDYIQDGLVCLFDGIENVGWGMHDSDSLYWVNLAGGYIPNAELIGGVFSNRSLVLDGTRYGAKVDYLFDIGDVLTIEVVTRADNVSYPKMLLSLGTIYSNSTYSGRWGTMGFFWGKGQFCMTSFSGNEGARRFPVSVGETFSVTSVLNEDGIRQGTAEASLPYKNGETVAYSLGSGTRDAQASFSAIGGTAWNYNWIGEIYVIRLYNRQLTADEIAYNYLVDKWRFGL